MTAFPPSTHHRLSVASRVLGTAIGGYALLAAIRLLILLLYPIADDGGHAVILAIYPIHVGILLWAFHARSVARVWGWLIGWTAAVYGACWLLIQFGGTAS